jgi:excisionase family DNA binding protein
MANTEENLEQLLSVDEVACLLGVPVATIYAWRYRRLGPPAIRVGRYLRFRRGDLTAWLRQQELGHAR